ncbi:MAG: helix-turn-helix domain-containing protein [Planctomycetaceae bacterium]
MTTTFTTGPTLNLLTVQEAALMLTLSRSMVYNLMERGSLAYVKIGRTRRIPVQEVERLVRESLVERRKDDASRG